MSGSTKKIQATCWLIGISSMWVMVYLFLKGVNCMDSKFGQYSQCMEQHSPNLVVFCIAGVVSTLSLLVSEYIRENS